MRSECNTQVEFIRRHCGSVAIEAPSGRATGAQRQGFFPYCRSILKGTEKFFVPVTLPGKQSRQGRACSGLTNL
jgi:hypothetical protein